MKIDSVKNKTCWDDVVNDCRLTVGKDALDHGPSDKFKRSILIAEHTPIRMVSIRWRFVGIKSWIATHFARHMFYKNVQSQRDDRTGVDRNKSPQDAPVNMVCELNGQNWIDVSRKRLCHQAHTETRTAWEQVLEEVKKIEPELYNVCVPNCVYRCGCPEQTTCGLYAAFNLWCIRTYNHSAGEFPTIWERYCAYHKFEEERMLKGVEA